MSDLSKYDGRRPEPQALVCFEEGCPHFMRAFLNEWCPHAVPMTDGRKQSAEIGRLHSLLAAAHSFIDPLAHPEWEADVDLELVTCDTKAAEMTEEIARLRAERGRLHELLGSARTLIDPEEFPTWDEKANAELLTCEQKNDALTDEIARLRASEGRLREAHTELGYLIHQLRGLLAAQGAARFTPEPMVWQVTQARFKRLDTNLLRAGDAYRAALAGEVKRGEARESEASEQPHSSGARGATLCEASTPAPMPDTRKEIEEAMARAKDLSQYETGVLTLSRTEKALVLLADTLRAMLDAPVAGWRCETCGTIWHDGFAPCEVDTEEGQCGGTLVALVERDR